MVNVTDTALWNQVTPELRSGEKLLWVGKPIPTRAVLANGDLMGSILGVIIIGVVIFLLNNFRMPGNLSSFAIFRFLPLFFVIIALLMFARPVYEFIMARRTVYAITSQRVLIIKQTFSGKKVESYTESSGIERTNATADMGDLVFARSAQTYRSNGRTRTRTRKIGFFGVPKVNEVEALMLRVFNRQTSNFDFE
jgi:hypothetical protein